MFVKGSVGRETNKLFTKPMEPNSMYLFKEKVMLYSCFTTLIIEAEDDHPFNKKACEILHTKVKGATKVVIKNSGHYPHLEHPSEFNATLLKFLQA